MYLKVFTMTAAMPVPRPIIFDNLYAENENIMLLNRLKIHKFYLV